MRVAIMQPYFFPYIGYFQLMRAVDVFVFYDDVQFIKNGWINRNRILVRDRPGWLTLPVKRDGHHTDHINRRSYALGDGVEPAKSRLRSAYARAGGFEAAYPFVSSLLDFHDPNVARFNVHLLEQTARWMGQDSRFAISSQLDKPVDLHGEAKVIELCRLLGADHYINPIGGIGLYDPQRFAAAGIRLSYLRTSVPPESIVGEPAHLSVLHMMFHESPARIADRLDQYELLPG